MAPTTRGLKLVFGFHGHLLIHAVPELAPTLRGLKRGWGELVDPVAHVRVAEMAPTARGLKLDQRPPVAGVVAGRRAGPDSEGIETVGRANRHSCEGRCRRDGPDIEGIETARRRRRSSRGRHGHRAGPDIEGIET